MAFDSENWLVETDWVHAHLEAPDLIIVDASWHLPTAGRDPKAEFAEAHVPGAIFFDIDEICDTGSDLPHMLASPAKFASRMRSLGIGDGMRIVVYDADGMFSAARVWWNFRVMGVEDVAVMNGGLAKWRREERPIDSGPAAPRPQKHFTARRDSRLVRDLSDVQRAMQDPASVIVDARSPGRFAGTAPEPREGLRLGHIPGSRNLHYELLLNDDGTIKSREELVRAFEAAGLERGSQIITTCGSGVTASILSFALAYAGYGDSAVYDGAWTEWGGRDDLPIETGSADAKRGAAG